MNHSSYMPHGWCLMWEPRLLFLMAASNIMIAVAYFSIPLQLIKFARKRKDLDIHLHWTLILFAAFIGTCGIAHIANTWTIWHPDYWFEACVKFATGIVSSIAAIVLIPTLNILTRHDTMDGLRAQVAALSSIPFPVVSSFPPIPTVSEQQIKEALTALEDLEFRLRIREAAVQFAQDPIVVTEMSMDPSAIKILMVNGAYCHAVGFAEDELVGRPPIQTLAGPLTDITEWIRTNEELFQGKGYVGHGVIYMKDGPMDVTWSSAPIPTMCGHQMRYCAVSIIRIIGPHLHE